MSGNFVFWRLSGAMWCVNAVWTQASFIRGDLLMFLWVPVALTCTPSRTRVASYSSVSPCMCLRSHVCTRDQCTGCRMWRAPGAHLSDQLWAQKLSVVLPRAPAPAHEYSPEPKMLIIISRWLSRAAARPHLLAAPFRPNSSPHQLEIEKCPPPANHQYWWASQQTRGIIYYNHVQVNKH